MILATLVQSNKSKFKITYWLILLFRFNNAENPKNPGCFLYFFRKFPQFQDVMTLPLPSG